ncbi:MAG: hypothetical protein ACD_32C00014G0005 [uncultured bacterium]|uniref:Glycosyltransferase 2-like domain-containing protein n=1 Tax=Candidatus Daviesbacteria bacterium GW2011_GWC2_40_12 TaxID=1618431 RepID=A0A0G0QQJ3_9BACT|nr:MAG: hypothetical protein ACD_32C00014G0005 [uncultured bacterium]KKQ83993.1 MAG: hypothetical protein UT04_C0021G0009 [Candidatus Daviesbacteria bacterium GW2011_GWF2_38_7]KKR17300.1 MAG: hypothetical protein UT45_C0002G0129 [Candidatus Daviesbacteria bacterium GW2011_GWA2_39_33]KKR42699.1 MAG: hypothetical protein UT77_C0001G0150 [Candidatus Daviesbacteria bacterium GW2011_GWC2_40_12]OGE21373.1 MAG: hypothetical protein A2778_04365 [Candidatus Daviesbacteria bacterium RIFCSPHIGHO2_01_FULL_
MKKIPQVSIIIVNYNGKHFLKECLSSVFNIDFPKSQYEIIMVDNDSKDDSVDYVLKNFSEVKVVQSISNLGFAEGCNLGVKNALGNFVVFLNTDTKVERNWLKALVKSIKSDKGIGAVNSKLLLYNPFFELLIHSDIFMRSDFSDSVNFQSVGVLVESVIIDDDNLQPLVRYEKGFYENEYGIIPVRWTKGDASILIPVDPRKNTIGMTVTIRSGKSISGLETQIALKLGEKDLIVDKLKSYEVKQYKISLETKELRKYLLYAVQNSGVVVFKNGYGRDRGAVVRGTTQFYEIDNPFFSQKAEIHAFTGASVIIRKEIFEKLGGFDDKYFMYYEDVDLGLRMQRQGYKIVYEPESVVYHIHSGSSKEWSRFFTYHVEKNHLATLVKHFPVNTILTGFTRYIGMLIISSLKMIKWRASEHWELYDQWREKVEIRISVLMWIFQHFIYFAIKRMQINMSQKKSMAEIIKKLY